MAIASVVCAVTSVVASAGGTAHAADASLCLSGDTAVHYWAVGQYTTTTIVDMCRRASDGAVYARFNLDSGATTTRGMQINLDFKSKTSSNVYTYYCAVGAHEFKTCQSGYWNWTKYSWTAPGLFVNWNGTWELMEWGVPWDFGGMSSPARRSPRD